MLNCKFNLSGSNTYKDNKQLTVAKNTVNKNLMCANQKCFIISFNSTNRNYKKLIFLVQGR
jgi:hypothetical protein